jgi:hypothetical protein
MNMNPYAPPQAHDDAQWAGVGQRIDPAEAERIRREIQRLNRTSLLLGAPGLLLQIVGQMMGGTTGAIVGLVGFALLVTGLTFYARMRGRSPWWGAAGIASCIGMLLLYVLPKHCHHCKARTTGPTCDKCGAPAPI